MIEVENLTKRYGPTLAVSDVTFQAQKGEVLGFLGPNGAGKTTTMRVITGYLPPSEGWCGWPDSTWWKNLSRPNAARAICRKPLPSTRI